MTTELFQVPICAICQQNLCNHISSLYCGHCFHQQCIENHLGFQKRCPYCKQPASKQQMRRIYYLAVEQGGILEQLKNNILFFSFLANPEVEQLILTFTIKQKEVQRLKQELRQEKQHCLFIKKNHQKLTKEMEKMNEEIQSQKTKYRRLVDRFRGLKKKFDSMESEHVLLKERCESLQTNLSVRELHSQILEQRLKGKNAVKEKLSDCDDIKQFIKQPKQDLEEKRMFCWRQDEKKMFCWRQDEKNWHEGLIQAIEKVCQKSQLLTDGLSDIASYAERKVGKELWTMILLIKQLARSQEKVSDLNSKILNKDKKIKQLKDRLSALSDSDQASSL